MTQVQRWTGVVSANENGGFVAYGDYLALQSKLQGYITDQAEGIAIAAKQQAEINALAAELAILKAAPKALVPLTDGDKLMMLDCLAYTPTWGRLEFYMQGIEDAERRHGIGGTP